MQDVQLIVTLLTITVILLSAVIVTLIVALIVLIVKLNRTVKAIERTFRNAAAITEWLTPAKLVGELLGAFRGKNKKK